MASRRQWIAVPRRPVYRTGFKPVSSRRFRKMRKRRKIWRKRTDRKNGRPWKGKDKTERRQIKKLLLIPVGHPVTEMIKGKDEVDSHPKFIVVFGWIQQWSMMLMVRCKNAGSSSVLVFMLQQWIFFREIIANGIVYYNLSLVSSTVFCVCCSEHSTVYNSLQLFYPNEVQTYTFLLNDKSSNGILNRQHQANCIRAIYKNPPPSLSKA